MIDDEQEYKALQKLCRNEFYQFTTPVPEDIKKMTVNLRAPLIINADTLKGGQMITEDENDVRFPIYDLLQKNAKGGE
jgi:flagellar assembly factor FliW